MCIYLFIFFKYFLDISINYFGFHKELLTEIQVVHHVDQDVEQVEHNSQYHPSAIIVLLFHSCTRKVDRQKALNPYIF